MMIDSTKRKKDEFAGIITQVEDDRYVIFLLNSNSAVKISSIVGIPTIEDIFVIGIVDAIDTQYYLENPDLYFVSKAANNSLEKISEGAFRPRFGQEARAKVLGYYRIKDTAAMVPVPDTSNRYTPKPLEKVYLFPADRVSSVLGLASSSQNNYTHSPTTFPLGRICYPFENYEAIFYQSIFNKHTLVAGTTGAGKSRLVALIIKNILYNNGHVTIVDPHNEYTNLLYSNQKKFTINIIGRVLNRVVEYLRDQKILDLRNKAAVQLSKQIVLDVKKNQLFDIEGANIKLKHLNEKWRKLKETLNAEERDLDRIELNEEDVPREKRINDIRNEMNKLLEEIADQEFERDDIQKRLSTFKENEKMGIFYNLAKEKGINVEPLQFTVQDISGASLSLLLPQITIQQEERLHDIIDTLLNNGKKLTFENLINEVELRMEETRNKKGKNNEKATAWDVYNAISRKLKDAEKRRLLIDDKPGWMNLQSKHVDIFIGDYNTDDFGKRYITTIIQQFLHFDIQNKEKILIIDEAHQLFTLQNPNTHRLVCQLLRESRKSNTAILMITQNTKDIPDEIIGQFQNLFRFRELGDKETGDLPDRMCAVSLYGAKTNFVMRVNNCPAYHS